ncbi:MAG: hypothetical protein JRN37_00495 [Nitrososphaerota archaeon]|nr:hypothetical protein [Nitrososphaerota archaeon]MDG7036912.1 hypothetical protein [Nitrososphaerota archaeon]MDG7037630.1 hypothetical protein [Nitrososphaerota archaeon]
MSSVTTKTFNFSTVNPFLSSIAPGSTMSYSTSITGTGPFLAGNKYTATFVVTYANGATQDITEGLVANSF